jgi:hypothetical protein
MVPHTDVEMKDSLCLSQFLLTVQPRNAPAEGFGVLSAYRYRCIHLPEGEAVKGRVGLESVLHGVSLLFAIGNAHIIRSPSDLPSNVTLIPSNPMLALRSCGASAAMPHSVCVED